VIQIIKKNYLYVYKAVTGESWFEYETDKDCGDSSLVRRLNTLEYSAPVRM
jgi:hypothetical protein